MTIYYLLYYNGVYLGAYTRETVKDMIKGYSTNIESVAWINGVKIKRVNVETRNNDTIISLK